MLTLVNRYTKLIQVSVYSNVLLVEFFHHKSQQGANPKFWYCGSYAQKPTLILVHIQERCFQNFIALVSFINENIDFEQLLYRK